MEKRTRRIPRPDEPARYVADLARGVERPLREEWYPDLLAIAEADWDDVFTLAAVFFEAQLRVRRRPTSRAVRVVTKVRPRLDELVGQPFPEDPDEIAGFGPFDDTSTWPEEGVLAHMGYRVGRRGRPTDERRQILQRAFDGPLPRVNGPEYMIGWGADESATRLQKMAWSIATFASMAQRRNRVGNSVAIAHWRGDLAWLRATYYEGYFGFPWPDVEAT